MSLPHCVKLSITILYVPLFLCAFALWVANTVNYEEQWECYKCRADTEPTILQQFLYFTMWQFWLTIAVFVTWSLSRPNTKLRNVSERLFWLALPLACSVLLGYAYYSIEMPRDGSFLNLQECHAYDGIGRIGLSKELVADHTTVAHVYLVVSIVSDVTVHYLCAPLLLILLFSGELEYSPVIPYSTVFISVLGGIVGLVVPNIYCGDIWFKVSMTIAVNFGFHTLLALWHHRSKVFFCCHTKEDRNKQDNGKTGKDQDIDITHRTDRTADIESQQDMVPSVLSDETSTRSLPAPEQNE